MSVYAGTVAESYILICRQREPRPGVRNIKAPSTTEKSCRGRARETTGTLKLLSANRGHFLSRAKSKVMFLGLGRKKICEPSLRSHPLPYLLLLKFKRQPRSVLYRAKWGGSGRREGMGKHDQNILHGKS